MRRRQKYSNATKPVETRQDYSGMPDGALVACYLSAFGEKPHHRMKRETIIKRLTDDASDKRA